MKKQVKFLCLFIFCVTFRYSLLKGQTTEEEYNYVSKGYKVQMDSGLDMKKGYSIEDFGNWGLTFGSEMRQADFKGLFRDGESKPCAIMMVYRRTDISNGAEYYICIPSIDASEELWQRTLDFINSNFKDNNAMLQTVIWALMKFSSMSVSE